MPRYIPLYEPPFATDMGKLRDDNLTNPADQPMLLHVGHFIAWYASAEFLLTLIAQSISKTDPAVFHELVRGMDGKRKVQALIAICDQKKISICPDLDARLDHFAGVQAGLRNKLVHSHLYWPEGDDLQLCSIGAPPLYQDLDLPGSDPEIIPGLQLFERALWLKMFALDLSDLFHAQVRSGRLEIAQYRSGLPRGHTRRKQRTTRVSTRGKRVQRHASQN